MSGRNADSDAYAAMVSALQQFQQNMDTIISSLNQAVQDCNDNMDQDPHALKRTAEVANVIPTLQDASEKAGELAEAISEEMNAIEDID